MPYLPYLASVAVAAWLVRQIAVASAARRRWLIVGFVAALGIGAYLTGRVSTGRGTPFGDFDKAYYPAGQAAALRPTALYDCGHADGLCFVNMPLVALAYMPLGMLARPAAHRIITAAGIAAVALAIGLLASLSRAKGAGYFAVAAAVLLNGPLYYSLRLANVTHIVLVVLVAALLALRRRRQVLAGALLAACAIAKPPFLLWLAYLGWRRHTRRAAVAFVATLAVGGAVSLLWFGFDLHRTWITEYVAGTSARPVGAYNAQSISGMLIRLTTTAYLVDWTGVEMSPVLSAVSTLLSALVVLAVGLVMWRTGEPASDDEALAEYSLILCAMLLISPISWTHYYALLLVPIAAWAAGRFAGDRSPFMVAAMGAAALLVSLPVTLWIPGDPFFGPVIARALLSHYVAGGALLLLTLAHLRLYGRVAPVQEMDDRGMVPQWNADAI